MEILDWIYCKHFDFTISCCGMDRQNQYKKVKFLKPLEMTYFYKFVDLNHIYGVQTVLNIA